MKGGCVCLCPPLPPASRGGYFYARDAAAYPRSCCHPSRCNLRDVPGRGIELDSGGLRGARQAKEVLPAEPIRERAMIADCLPKFTIHNVCPIRDSIVIFFTFLDILTNKTYIFDNRCQGLQDL